MDPKRFDTATRMLGIAGRRRLLTAGLGATLAGRLAPIFVRDQPVAAAAACAKVGKSCRQAAQCCSGICAGKHGKKKCRGHDAGTCQRGQDACTDPDPNLDACNNDDTCQCFRTTAGTSFCAGQDSACAVCATDADCLALLFPPGSACGSTIAGRCNGLCASGTICFVPCPTPPPA